MCYLQESKLEVVSLAMWRDIGGTKLDEFAFVPAVGSAGGIIIGWNSGLLKGQIINIGSFSLTVDFFSMRENFLWRCTAVYGPNPRALKTILLGRA